MIRISITGLLMLTVVASAKAQPASEVQVAPPANVQQYAPAPYPPPPVYAWGPYRLNSEFLRRRINEVKRERALLIRDGRPEHWLARKVGGLAGIAIGGSALATVTVLVMSPGFGPHSSERTYSTAERLAYPIAALFGAATLGVGAWAVKTAGSPNPHQPRIDALREEYEQLTRDYKYERRRERLERRAFSLLPSVTRVQASTTRFMLVLSTTL
jgi:hypothetical protein